MLQDPFPYRLLDNDPTKWIQSKVQKLLDDGIPMGIFTKNMAEKLYVEFPINPVYHSLPKTHNDGFPPKMRPIVAGIGSVTEK